MSVLMTNAQREKRAAAEAAVVQGLEEELAAAARELEAAVAEFEEARAEKDAAAAARRAEIEEEAERVLAPYRLAAERYGDEVAAEAERKRAEAVAVAEASRDARIATLRAETEERKKEIAAAGALEVAAGTRNILRLAGGFFTRIPMYSHKILKFSLRGQFH